MGSDGLQASTEVLETEGRSFVRHGEAFVAAVQRLQGSLSSLEGSAPPSGDSTVEAFVKGLTTLESKATSPPWGDDEIGEQFGVVYEGLRDGMYESMGHLAAKMQEIGKALRSMAKNHEEGEDFTESLMKQHVANSQANSEAIWTMKSPHH